LPRLFAGRNVLYDFDLAPYGFPAVAPYVGTGYDEVEFANCRAFGFGGLSSTNPILIRETATKGSFAAQGTHVHRLDLARSLRGAIFEFDRAPPVGVEIGWRRCISFVKTATVQQGRRRGEKQDDIGPEPVGSGSERRRTSGRCPG
jgi:hypothetical protein